MNTTPVSLRHLTHPAVVLGCQPLRQTLFTLIALALLPLAVLHGDVPLQNYTWTNLAIGGGGYITGLVAHPPGPGAYRDIYARTDVGGAYRYDSTGEGKWIPLNDRIPFDEVNRYGIDGIAVSNSNREVVYICAGKDATNVPDTAGLPCAVYKSVDRGESWVEVLGQDTATTIPAASFRGNDTPRDLTTAERFYGEPIAVDPHPQNLGKCVYAALRVGGVYWSFDYGATWQPISDPDPNPGINPFASTYPHAVRCIAFDPAQSWTRTLGGKAVVCSRRIYIGRRSSVAGEGGVWASDNAGETWTRLLNSPSYPAHMQVDAWGKLWVTASVPNSNSGGVYTCQAGDTSMVQVQTSTGLGSYSYNALAVHPTIQGKVVVVRSHQGVGGGSSINLPIYRTTNGGGTWQQLANSIEEQVAWRGNGLQFFSAATASAVFDPNNTSSLLLADWYSVWRTTTDVTAQTVNWKNAPNGHEEICVRDLATFTNVNAPRIISSVLDCHGFFHSPRPPDGTWNYPAAYRRLQHWSFGNAVTTSDDSFVALAGCGHQGDEAPGIYTTTNRHGNPILWVDRTGGLPSGLRTVRIAVASSDKNKAVVVSAYDVDPGQNRPALVYHTQNLNPSSGSPTWSQWTAASGSLPSGALLSGSWSRNDPLDSDKEWTRFYLYTKAGLYRNYGNDTKWYGPDSGNLPRNESVCIVKAMPGTGRGGHVWVGFLRSSGSTANALYRSTNEGFDFQGIVSTDGSNSIVTRVVGFGFGVRRPTASPTDPAPLYLYGVIRADGGSGTEEYGLFMSENAGGSWKRIDTSTSNDSSGNALGNLPYNIEGDKVTFGRVYVGSAGRGIFQGDIQP